MIRRFIVLFLTLGVALAAACTQSPAKEAAPAASAPPPAAAPAPAARVAHAFRGKVVSVDATAKSLSVDGENVEGWMGAMTMMYGTDKPEVLATLKPGDQVTATVYDGDFATLHDLQVAAKTEAPTSPATSAPGK